MMAFSEWDLVRPPRFVGTELPRADRRSRVPDLLRNSLFFTLAAVPLRLVGRSPSPSCCITGVGFMPRAAWSWSRR